MIVTWELWKQGKSYNGGYGKQQQKMICEYLGIDCTEKDWMGKSIGQEIPDENARQFLALKDAHIKKSNIPNFIPFQPTNVPPRLEPPKPSPAFKPQAFTEAQKAEIKEMLMDVIMSKPFEKLLTGMVTRAMEANR